MRILITGASGQVGTEAVRRAPSLGVEAVGLDRARLDVTDPEAVHAAIEQHRPEAVVNAAAYTAVDRAESDPEAASAVNRDGPAHLADACARLGLPLVHLSTDYVFDGTKGAPYGPDDPVAPVNVYGTSKAAGESEVRSRLGAHAILRTAWVFGAHGSNFVQTILRLAAGRDRLTIVADQWGHPTWAGDVARAALVAAERLATGRLGAGTYHVAGAPLTTWHGLAEAVVEAARARGLIEAVAVDPIPTSAYPTPAQRPARVELAMEASFDALGLTPFEWGAALFPIVEEGTGRSDGEVWRTGPAPSA
ncbi:MAG: dTDP-4-dehydrorhamnose reductase [Bacteroidota bacterium]